jgi:chemotaxis protein MotB
MSGQGHDSSGSMRWLLTYADMITLLLAFFVVLYAISKVDAKKYQALASSLQGIFGNPPPSASAPQVGGAALPPRVEPMPPKQDLAFEIVEGLQASLEAELGAGRIQIERNPRGVLLRFQDTLLFDVGKADLRPEARAVLDKVAATIAPLPYPIEAEGHTDTLPIRSGPFPSNWELSVARATAVVRYLVEAHTISPTRLAARGVAEHKPLYPNDPIRGEPRNRRVELTIITSR